jgi:HSP20 family molecular chaperone IbpA
MYFSHPVVYVAQSAPYPSRLNERPRHDPHFTSGGPAGSGHNHGPLNFLKKLALTIVSLFTLSMVFRLFLLLVAIAFSPPVLLLCLFGLLFSHQDWGNGRFTNSPGCYHIFNTRSGGASSGPCRRRCTRNTRSSAESEASTRGEQQQQQERQKSELEVKNTEEPLNDNNTSSIGDASPSSTPLRRSTANTARYHKVHVHRDETDKTLSIAFDISGFEVSDIQVTVDNSEVIIRGDRKNVLGDTFLVEERVALDEDRFLEDSVKAQALDGIMMVTIQKKPAPKPRVISITTTNNTDNTKDN